MISAAILIGAEVFGAAFAGGWAIGNLFGLGEYGTYILQVLFFVLGIAVMVAFIRAAQRVEPFTTRRLSRSRAPRRRLRQQFANEFRARAAKKSCIRGANHLFATCPISHVPVAVCRSVGIRTRGRTAA